MSSSVISCEPGVRTAKPLFAEKFPFLRPVLPSLDDVATLFWPAYVRGALTNGALVARLEAAVAERLNVPHCVAVSSCTSGLVLTLRALGVTGEVILPSFTFFAAGNALLWNGVTPVFADCDPETWTIDPADVERKITSRTSAIVAVHLYGNPCRVDQLQQIATRYKLKLIFDAAHAFGSRYGGRAVGQFGDAEVFSLSPTKLLVAGEGGFVTTNDARLAHSIRAARNYGDLGAYDPELLGLNARMPEFNAALALAGLELIDAKIERHNQIADHYTSVLKHVHGLRFQKVEPQDLSTYKDYSVCVGPEYGLTRDELAAALLAENIETKKYFHPPLHQQKLYKPYHAGPANALRNTELISGGVLSLPICASMTDETADAVAAAIVGIRGRLE